MTDSARETLEANVLCLFGESRIVATPLIIDEEKTAFAVRTRSVFDALFRDRLDGLLMAKRRVFAPGLGFMVRASGRSCRGIRRLVYEQGAVALGGGRFVASALPLVLTSPGRFGERGAPEYATVKISL